MFTMQWKKLNKIEAYNMFQKSQTKILIQILSSY